VGIRHVVLFLEHVSSLGFKKYIINNNNINIW
jgi:hypothetical protein